MNRSTGGWRSVCDRSGPSLHHRPSRMSRSDDRSNMVLHRLAGSSLWRHQRDGRDSSGFGDRWRGFDVACGHGCVLVKNGWRRGVMVLQLSTVFSVVCVLFVLEVVVR